MVPRPPGTKWILLGASIAAIFSAGCEDGQLGLASMDPAALSAAQLPSGPCTTPEDRNALVSELIDAVNRERRKAGVAPMRKDPTLMAIADFYSCRLIDGEFFAHVDPEDGSTVAERAADFGYAFAKIGENLAGGQQSAQEAVVDWMKSAKHRANLLDPAFTEIGVAVKDGGRLGRIWVQEFGRALDLSTPDLDAPVAGEQPPPSQSDVPAASSRPGSSSE